MNLIAQLPTLGVGLSYRDVFRSDLFLARREIDFLEIIADHYFDLTPEKEEELKLLLENFVLIPHGLNLSLGSADGVDPEYLERFAELLERIKPPWWSEHIAFTRAGGVYIGHLAPMPFTREAVDVLCGNIQTVQARVRRPLILENITYMFRIPGAELSEPEFLTAILKGSNSGLLLDVTNLYANARNHRFSAREFLERIPLERVAQLHFAGGVERSGRYIDSHSAMTEEPIWGLLGEVLDRSDTKGVILERDDHFPPFADLLAEIRRARAVWETVRGRREAAIDYAR